MYMDTSMSNSIMFRLAQRNDILDIWRLLHSDSKTINEEDIARQYQSYFLLLYGNKLLAVYDFRNQGIDTASCITVHPMYPRELLEEGINRMVDILFMKKSLMASKSGTFGVKSAINSIG